MNAVQRKMLGAEQVGLPVNQIHDAITRFAAMEQYQQIRYDAVEYYCEEFLFSHLISLIDESWSDEQFEASNPDVVKFAIIMLLRDMMQTHRHSIVRSGTEQSWDTQWIEQFTAGLFYEARTPMQPYMDWLEVIEEGKEEPTEMLIAALAKQIEVDVMMLYVYHMSACDITRKDVFENEDA